MSFDPIAHYYDADHGKLQEDIPVLLAFAHRTGGPVLELGVGTGRLALPLAEAGYEVTGVDASAAMLNLCRRRLAAAGLEARVTLVQADFADIDLQQDFALAYCGFNSFLHLIDVADQVAALRCWRRHLRAGGLLVVDVHNPDLARLAAADGSLEFSEHWIDAETGGQVQKFFASAVSFADQVHEVHIFYDEIGADGGVRRTAAHMPTRILFRRELATLLEMSGFGGLEFYGDYDLAPWQADSPNIIAVARAR